MEGRFGKRFFLSQSGEKLCKQIEIMYKKFYLYGYSQRPPEIFPELR